MSTIAIAQSTEKKIKWEYTTITLTAVEFKSLELDYTYPGKPHVKKNGETVTIVLKKPLSSIRSLKPCHNCGANNKVLIYLNNFSCFNCGTVNAL